MSKRPSFQFYPADWRNNAKLRRCSDAARGAWMDILCLLHDGDEYGVCRWPLEDLARAAGVAMKLARELVDKLVLKGADNGPVTYVHNSSHAGKDLPVVLIETTGPCWFSSRLVTDEWRRTSRATPTQFTPETQPNKSPKPTIGDKSGYGSTTSSSSSPSEDKSSLRSDTRAKPSKQKGSEPEGFAEFYAVFPKKKHPDKAKSTYAAALKRGATPAALLDGARRYALERAGENPQFTQYPATWLNAGAWREGDFDQVNPDAVLPLDVPQAVNGHTRPICTQQPGETREHFIVRRFKETGMWLATDGAPPNDLSTCMPRDVLREFGYTQREDFERKLAEERAQSSNHQQQARA